MSKSMEKLKHYAEVLDSRSLRERVYLLLIIIVLLVVGWDQLFLSPSFATRKITQSEIARVSGEIVQLQADEALVLQQAKEDPDVESRKQIEQLIQAINNLDQQLETKFIDLLTPRQMPLMLQKLLKGQRSLQLVKMENLPPEQMMNALGGDEPTPLGIYIHALNMELEGSYLDLLKYLQALEQMEQQVFWDILTIDTKNLSTAKIRLQIHTLSLTEDWIGV